MHRYHTDWLSHTEYLQERTPLSERQADVLALMKTGQSIEEISDTLGIPADKVEGYRDDMLDQWDRAQELCTILGPHPWGDGETRKDDDVDDTTWNLLTSAEMNHSDEDRTRVELELYFGYEGVWNNTYLLVEREIKDIADYATETTEKRGAYGSNGLRDHIYKGVESIDDYFLRYMLLHKAGINPSGKGAPYPDTGNDADFSQNDLEDARERARDKVDIHFIE